MIDTLVFFFSQRLHCNQPCFPLKNLYCKFTACDVVLLVSLCEHSLPFSTCCVWNQKVSEVLVNNCNLFERSMQAVNLSTCRQLSVFSNKNMHTQRIRKYLFQKVFCWFLLHYIDFTNSFYLVTNVCVRNIFVIPCVRGPASLLKHVSQISLSQTILFYLESIYQGEERSYSFIF